MLVYGMVKKRTKAKQKQKTTKRAGPCYDTQNVYALTKRSTVLKKILMTMQSSAFTFCRYTYVNSCMRYSLVNSAHDQKLYIPPVLVFGE